MQDNRSFTEKLMDLFGFKSSENQGRVPSSSSSTNSSSSKSDYELVNMAQNMSWRDLFRPSEVFTQIFHPSSIDREEAAKSGGLLDIFDKNSAGRVLDSENNGAYQTQRNEPFSWKGLFQGWFQNNFVAQTDSTQPALSQSNSSGPRANQPNQPAQNQPTQTPVAARSVSAGPVEQQGLESKDQALIQAIENKDEKQVVSLLNEGANPNALTQYGESALQLAVESGSVEIVDALISHQADVNKVAATPEAKSPLLLAAERGDEAMVHRLLEAGADVKQKDEQGKTAMHYATSRAMLGDLIEHGGDLMAEDLNGRSPLHDMVARGEYEVIEEALFYGADPLKADVNGRTALQEAALNGHESIYQSLQDYMTLVQEGAGAHDPNLTRAIQEAGSEVVSTQESPSIAIERAHEAQQANG